MRARAALSTLSLVLVSTLLAGLLPARAVAATRQAPRPARITPAERSAVALAVSYLSEGPESWWDALSADSHLRALGKEAAIAEIEVRVGPPDEITWELQTVVDEDSENVAAFMLQYPSGLDEALFLDLVEEAGDWRIRSLRTWAEPSPESEAEEVVDLTPADEGPALERLLWIAALIVSAFLLALALLLVRRRSPASILILAMAVAVAIVGWVWRGNVEEPDQPEVEAAVALEEIGGNPDLRDLLDLRRAMVEGRDNELVDALFERLPERGRVESVGLLWQAQYRLQGGDLEGAEELLGEFDQPSRYPLAEILRGRLAFLRGEGVDAAAGFERARSELPEIDGIRIEAAEALLLLGFEVRAQSILELLAELGTRRADAYYWLSRFSVVDQKTDEALVLIQSAFRLHPLERQELIGDPIYAFLVRKGELFDLLRVMNPEEPRQLVSELGAEAIGIPAEFEATYTGRTLRIAYGDSEILVPGGARLAPPAARSEDALSRRRRIEGEALAELPELIRATQSVGSITQPALRNRIVTAAEALARNHRWLEVLQLTDPVAEQPENLPTRLAWRRVEALNRNRQEYEATQLLLQMAKAQVATSRKDPATFLHLANYLARAAEFDLAIRMAQIAEAQSPEGAALTVVPRIRMEKRLAEDFQVHESRHFEVRFPSNTDRHFVAQLTDVLEKEFIRIQRWVPYTSYKPIEVNLFPYKEYSRVFDPSRSSAGMYDGKVRLPFADIPTLHPVIVSVFTHEITHAMIGEATDDQAPSWFQEGLAQHVEMIQRRINPIPAFFERGSYLSFPLIDPILANYPEASLVSIGYEQAMWIMHYIERRHGVRGIHRLLDSFKAGRSTEQAIADALGMTANQLDADFRKWALTEAPKAWFIDVIRYDRPKTDLQRSGGR